MKQILKQAWPEVAAIVFFLLLSFSYFATPLSQGLVLTGEDNTAAIGSGKEIGDYANQTGEITRWTNSLFSGMPTYMMTPVYGSRTVLNDLRDIYDLGLPHVMMYVFILLLGFYILMRTMRVKPLLATVGAVLWAFSSYFFIIIAAGHIWKVLTLAFIPPTLAGIVLCYRGKYLWGSVVTTLFLAFQILSNHLQMTYYFLIVIFFMVLAYFIQAIKEKKYVDFCKASGVLAVSVLLAVAANASNLYHTYKYSKESMRGKSELATQGTSKSSGLTKEYITQWSYGIDETWTLLIPNAKGGASVPLVKNESAMEKANPQYMTIFNQMQQYWGDQPMTSGPVYVGAFVLMLFILSLFIVKGPMKWGLLAATILSILLSWGHNFMGLTSFFIDYIPLYNKFRTVSSILVVAEFTIPLLAIMALVKIINEPDILQKKMKWVWTSFALTGGISVLFALMPTLFFSDFYSVNEANALNNALANQPGMAGSILANMSEVRQSIFTADAWRSAIIVIIGMAFLLMYKKKIIKANVMVILIGVLCLIDMYSVNRRYLNIDNFEEPHITQSAPQKTQTDEQILQDRSLDYRVLNFASNTFNENETSYYHKSIGGYSAAKLGRYNDLISHDIVPEMSKTTSALIAAQGDIRRVNGDTIFPVLNMLNTKYFIMPVQDQHTVPVMNPYAMGNAWVVNKVNFVTTANAEIEALSKINLHDEAVANEKYKNILSSVPAQADSADEVTLTQYQCNEMHYDVNTKNGGLVVFSEIYYPDWTATMDGKPLELACVNYVLRGAVVPAGKHQIVMEFRPASVKTTEAVAYVGIVLMILSLVTAIVMWIRQEMKAEKK